MGDLIAGGPAEKEGTLVQGDQILSVNDEEVKDGIPEDVAHILKVQLLLFIFLILLTLLYYIFVNYDFHVQT